MFRWTVILSTMAVVTAACGSTSDSPTSTAGDAIADPPPTTTSVAPSPTGLEAALLPYLEGRFETAGTLVRVPLEHEHYCGTYPEWPGHYLSPESGDVAVLPDGTEVWPRLVMLDDRTDAAPFLGFAAGLPSCSGSTPEDPSRFASLEPLGELPDGTIAFDLLTAQASSQGPPRHEVGIVATACERPLIVYAGKRTDPGARVVDTEMAARATAIVVDYLEGAFGCRLDEIDPIVDSQQSGSIDRVDPPLTSVAIDEGFRAAALSFVEDGLVSDVSLSDVGWPCADEPDFDVARDQNPLTTVLGDDWGLGITFEFVTFSSDANRQQYYELFEQGVTCSEDLGTATWESSPVSSSSEVLAGYNLEFAPDDWAHVIHAKNVMSEVCGGVALVGISRPGFAGQSTVSSDDLSQAVGLVRHFLEVTLDCSLADRPVNPLP